MKEKRNFTDYATMTVAQMDAMPIDDMAYDDLLEMAAGLFYRINWTGGCRFVDGHYEYEPQQARQRVIDEAMENGASRDDLIDRIIEMIDVIEDWGKQVPPAESFR